MLPANHESPHLRSRWLQLKNVGAVTIPAFGVCEIVDASRPESGGSVTPGGGPRLIHVRRTTTATPCSTIVNGPCEIPANKVGRPGTYDDPMLALVAEEYDPGTDVGLPKDSFILTEGYCGYRIVGDYDATTGTQTVIRWDNCANILMVRALSCIYPGEGGSAQPMRWNEILQCWEDDPTKAAITLIDPANWLLAVTDDCFKVERDDCTQQSYRPFMPYGLHRVVKVKTEIACGVCGEVTVLKMTVGGGGRCRLGETACVLQACNLSYRKLACDAEEYANLDIIPGECCSTLTGCLAVLTPFPRPMFAEATAGGSVCATDASISAVEYKDVCEWTARTPPTTAKNPIGLYACNGDALMLRWNEADCGWDIEQVQPHLFDGPLVDAYCTIAGCGLSGTKIKGQIAVQQCNDCDLTEEVPLIVGELITVITGVEDGLGGDSFTALTGVSCVGCGLTFPAQNVTVTPMNIKSRRICILCPGAEAESEGAGPGAVSIAATADVTLAGTNLDVLTDVQAAWDDGSGGGGSGECPVGSGSATLTLTGKTKTICTFCSADGGGSFTDGADVDLLGGLPIGKMEALVGADFSCDPCPSLQVTTKTFWALCLNVENTEWAAQSCTCIDCDTGSGSGA